DNLPMNRRVLETSRALIVHSEFMAGQVRRAGGPLPIAVIPHGASMPEANPHAWRHKLGVDESTPLIGIFGFLKPYKRVAESLRAFQRLVRQEPRVRLILVGEEHPELPIRRLISSLGLESHARVLGYVPLEDFQQYIGAVDICLNLRYPTVGESSGSLLRALGLGRAVLVSQVGSFAELPDEICLKVPVDEHEVDFIFEYLNLLVTRPELARTMGETAKRYVAGYCSWDRVAEMYADFLRAVNEGREWTAPPAPAKRLSAGAPDTGQAEHLPAEPAQTLPAASFRAEATATPLAERPSAEPSQTPLGASLSAEVPAPLHPWAEYILGYAAESEEKQSYVRMHLTRLVRTLEITPRGSAEDRILEMGAYMQITPALKYLLGYGEVRGSYLGAVGRIDQRETRSTTGEVFCCSVDHFDAER